MFEGLKGVCLGGLQKQHRHGHMCVAEGCADRAAFCRNEFVMFAYILCADMTE